MYAGRTVVIIWTAALTGGVERARETREVSEEASAADWSVCSSLSRALKGVPVIGSTARVVLLVLTRAAIVLEIFGK